LELIRPARSEDCAELADLILLSDSGLLTVLFPGGPRTTICYLALHRKNPLSFEHASVIEEDGRLLGAAVGSRGGAIRGERLTAAWLIFRHFGLRAPARFVELSRAGSATDGIADKDFYLSNIAVVPQAQGKGLGTRLLLSVELGARSGGAASMVLDVALENARATAFYAAHGYHEERIVILVLSDGRSFHYRRLRKSLQDPLPIAQSPIGHAPQ